MEIKYKNKDRVLILQQQAVEEAEYYKCFYNNDILIKEVLYLNGVLYGIHYHNRTNEKHQEILTLHYTHDDLEFCIIDHVFYNNGYRLEQLSSYENEKGDLVGRTNCLFDGDNELVGHEMFLRENTIPEYQSTKKYYYDKGINPVDHLFEAVYHKSNGAFDYITFNQNHTDPFGQDAFALSNASEDIQRLIEITGMPQELIDYYLTANVVPNFKQCDGE